MSEIRQESEQAAEQSMLDDISFVHFLGLAGATGFGQAVGQLVVQYNIPTLVEPTLGTALLGGLGGIGVFAWSIRRVDQLLK